MLSTAKPTMLSTDDGPYASASWSAPSRSARVLRTLPLLGLLVTAAMLGFSALRGGSAGATPDELRLSIGKPFVQGIISIFEMKVDQITLNQPPSKWAYLEVGLITFDLVMDVHMDMLFFGAQATLGSAQMILSFRGQPFGVLQTQPSPLGGGGKIKSKMAGTLVVDDNEVFRKVALAVIEETEFTVELYAILDVELRGTDNGCMLRKEMCATVGSMRIPGVEFAKSVTLQGAQGFSVSMDHLAVTDLPSTEPAGRALIKVLAQVYNPSSFVLTGLDVMSLDVYTDDSWPFTEKPAADSLGVKFAEVNSEPGFWLGRGRSEWFPVEGLLSLPEREYDLVKTADVFNHFLTSRPTPLIPYITGSSQPFMGVAAHGAAFRAFLPGMPPGDNNIVQQVYIDLNIPVAVATLLNPVNVARLHQWCTIELKNPLNATLYVIGLTAEIMYHDHQVGIMDMPVLEEDQRIIIPPGATFRTAKSYPVELFGQDLGYILLLLNEMNPIGCAEDDLGCGIATVDLNARIKVRVGGVEPILTYKQYNVSVRL